MNWLRPSFPTEGWEGRGRGSVCESWHGMGVQGGRELNPERPASRPGEAGSPRPSHGGGDGSAHQPSGEAQRDHPPQCRPHARGRAELQAQVRVQAEEMRPNDKWTRSHRSTSIRQQSVRGNKASPLRGTLTSAGRPTTVTATCTPHHQSCGGNQHATFPKRHSAAAARVRIRRKM